MKRLATAQQMQKIDEYTINTIGIKSLVLMERAGYSVYEEIIKIANLNDKILIVCGLGNNAADGLVVARYLINDGYNVTIAIKDIQSKSLEYNEQLRILKNLNIKLVNYTEIYDKEYDIIVDAIFGTGLSKDVKNEYEKVICAINEKKAYKIAVDIPSGINATTGRIMNVAIKANLTITFGLEKVGHNIYPGRLYSGRVVLKDIGFLKDTMNTIAYTHYTYDNDFNRLPKRKDDSHKGHYGKVLIVAGSKDMFGALYFAAKSAYLAGSGLVYIYTHKDNKIAINTRLPEAICYTYDDKIDEDKLKYLIETTDVCMVGSGLSTNDVAKNLLSTIVEIRPKNLVLDADAINIIDKEMIKNIHSINTIITPHIKEFTRLAKRFDMEILDDNIKNSIQFSKNYNIKLILKDASTIVVENEENIYINTTGNNSLSKGGSGDILAGIVASFIGQKMDSYEAMRLSCFIHGKMAERISKIKGKAGVLASDILSGWRIDE